MMNEQFTNDDRDEDIARKLKDVAEQTQANVHFAAALEERLRDTRTQKTGPFTSRFRQISPAVRWVALMLLLGLVLSWSIRNLIPAPQPAADNTPGLPDILTPTPEGIDLTPTAAVPTENGYDWRGATLFLAAPLPDVPAEANVYRLTPDQPATAEEARFVAQRFGIDGDMYRAPGELPDTTSYMISDGRQRLYVRSRNYFTYYADYNANTLLLGARDLSEDDARTAIDSFLSARGFDFDYQIEKDEGIPGLYYAILLMPDGHPIHFDYNMPSRLQMTLGKDGQIISVDSSQIDYEMVGTYGVRSAEEAFQQVLGNPEVIQNGVLESSRSGGMLNESYWERSYPDDKTITIYGRVTSFDPVDPAKPPFVSINSYTATGNTPTASGDQLVEATGQFHTANGMRSFEVESWKLTDATETAVMGSLTREGNQTVLISDLGGKYVIADAPADVPLDTVPPDEQLMVGGFMANEDLVWTTIQYFPTGSNFGGGGGGGTGFHKLNLSGTAVPFSTPTAAPESNQTPAESPLVGKHLEKQRGTLTINIYKGEDGTQRPEFSFITQTQEMYLYATLENVSLEELLPYQNRPLDIWGTVETADAYGTAVISVDKFEAPYPGLAFQLIKGTQKNSEIDGNPVTLFTAEDGKTYVQMTRDNGLDSSIAGEVGDQVLVEALIIPDQTFGNYPVVQVFAIGLATNPMNGEPAPMTITADQPYVMDASLDPTTYVPPNSTIETVELVYYLPDPRYATPDTGAEPQYIQPAWRFAGHNSNGDVFEILVQALKEEYLLPELDTYTPPG